MKEIVILIYILLTGTLCVLSSSAVASTYDVSPFGINGLKFAHARNDPNVWKNAALKAKVMKDAGIYWDPLGNLVGFC